MALTRTTLASAMTATDQFITVTSATGFAAGQLIVIDGEYMVTRLDYGTAPFTSTFIPVFRRGDQGSKVVAHNALAEVVTAANAFNDMAALAQWEDMQKARMSPDTVWYSVSGAIAVPTRDTTALLNKAGVAVMTLAAPGKDQTGLVLQVISDTAQAHTITATSLIADGTSGSPHTTATFAAYRGASITLKAEDGVWAVVANNNVTIS